PLARGTAICWIVSPTVPIRRASPLARRDRNRLRNSCRRRRSRPPNGTPNCPMRTSSTPASGTRPTGTVDDPKDSISCETEISHPETDHKKDHKNSHRRTFRKCYEKSFGQCFGKLEAH